MPAACPCESALGRRVGQPGLVGCLILLVLLGEVDPDRVAGRAFESPGLLGALFVPVLALVVAAMFSTACSVKGKVGQLLRR